LFVSALSAKYLSQINALMIRQYLSKRLEKVTPATVNRDFSMLRSMFNRAIEWEMFRGSNPTKGMKPIPEKNCRCRWLSEEEQEQLLSHCQGITKVIVMIALQTGMRWGEIMNLKWRQSPNSNYVDFDSGTIFIHESLAKTDRSRFIPISSAVRFALKDVPKKPGVDYIFLNSDTKKPLVISENLLAGL
jgi:integrase